MKNTFRYKQAILAKLRMLQAQHDYERAKNDLSKSLLLSETNNYDFDANSSRLALKELCQEGVIEIEECQYVTAKLAYKDCDIYLHASLDSRPCTVMENIFK